MTLNLQPLLDKKRLAYKIIRTPDQLAFTEDWIFKTVPPEQIGQVQILQDRSGIVLCLFPAGHVLNIEALKHLLRRPLESLEPANQEVRLAQLISGIGSAFAEVIIDESLSNHDTTYLRGNNELQLLALDSEQLSQLHNAVLLGSTFSDPSPAATTPSRQADEISNCSLLERIKEIDKLPILPESAQQLLLLKEDTKGTVTQLVSIIEKDLSLAAQITRYANSPLFGLHGSINTLHDAIFRVLGYETTLYLSLGIGLSRGFKQADKGPLGCKLFWQHATYSAALSHTLANLMPKSQQVQPGIAYLAGLLHDIGTLVMATLFKEEFCWLNKMACDHPQEPIRLIEERLFGTTHMQLGDWLITYWGLPEELSTVTAQHHNLNYTGAAEHYVQLISLVDRLLKTHGMSDADSEEVPLRLFEQLGLDEGEVYEAIDQVVQGSAILDSMVTTLST